MAVARKGDRVSGTERARLAADLRTRYDAGLSIRALAAATGRSYGFVHRMLTESGATLRHHKFVGVPREAPARAATGDDEAVRRGAVMPASARGPRPVPKPVKSRGGLSDIVIGQRS
jgi:hypothetical protein